MNIYLVIPFLTISFFVCSFTSCNKKEDKKDKDIEVDNVLYTIPFKGRSRMFIDGMVNDSIEFDIGFDTGAAAGMAFSSTAKDSFNIGDSLKLQLAEVTRIIHGGNPGGTPIIFEQHKKYTGRELGILGWEFFKDDIVQISWKDNFMKILRDTSELDAYYRIAYNREKHHFLETIVTLNVQNKEYKLNMIIDTGMNGTFLINEEKIKGIEYLETKGSIIGLNNLSMPMNGFIADSLKVGSANIYNIEVQTVSQNINPTVFNFSDGFIGTEFLKGYTVVFDFRNNVMYLKASPED